MENMNSVWGFIGIIVFACGVYAIYSYIKMKKDGEINASILLGKDFMYKKCKDKEAYIKKVGPALLGFGFVAIVYGILDVIHCYVYPMAAVDTVGTDRQFSATGLGTITVGGGVYGWQIDQDSEVAQLTQELENQTVTEREPVYSSREVSTENNGFGNSYVEIDLSRQHLWLYQNGQLMVESDIVSGTMTEDRYTPPGIFQMYYKQRDKVLKGEIQEDGEPEYEQPVSFWMPFNGGIGLHDATWNSSFGGDKYIYSGSHGCINLPYDIAEQIYNIIDTEMPIICYYSQPYTLHD